MRGRFFNNIANTIARVYSVQYIYIHYILCFWNYYESKYIQRGSFEIVNKFNLLILDEACLCFPTNFSAAPPLFILMK